MSGKNAKKLRRRQKKEMQLSASNGNIKSLAVTISIILLIGSIIWFGVYPSFEPLLLVIGEIGGLFALTRDRLRHDRRVLNIISVISIITFGLGIILIWLRSDENQQLQNHTEINVSEFEQHFYGDQIENNYYEVPESVDTNVKAIIANGDDAFDRGSYDIALSYYEVGRDEAIRSNDQEGLATAFIRIGDAFRGFDDFITARQNYDQAQRIASDNNYLDLDAMALRGIANLQYESGLYQDAIYYYDKASTIFNQISDHQSLGEVYKFIGFSYRNLGSLDKALDFFMMSLEAYRLVGDKSNEEVVLTNLARTQYEIGDFESALENYLKLFDMTQKTGTDGQVLPLLGMGRTYASLGKIQEAFDAYSLAARYSIKNDSFGDFTNSAFDEASQLSGVKIVTREDSAISQPSDTGTLWYLPNHVRLLAQNSESDPAGVISIISISNNPDTGEATNLDSTAIPLNSETDIMLSNGEVINFTSRELILNESRFSVALFDFDYFSLYHSDESIAAFRQ